MSRRFTSAIKWKRLNLEIRIEFSIIRHVSAIGVAFITARSSVYNQCDENADYRNGMKWDSVDSQRIFELKYQKVFRQRSAVKRVLDWWAVARITQMRRDMPRAVEWRKIEMTSRAFLTQKQPHTFRNCIGFQLTEYGTSSDAIWETKNFSARSENRFQCQLTMNFLGIASRALAVVQVGRGRFMSMWTNRQTSRPIIPELSPLPFTPRLKSKTSTDDDSIEVFFRIQIIDTNWR